jgi:pimeloyl-ACP methyl ester carboxylesterase
MTYPAPPVPVPPPPAPLREIALPFDGGTAIAWWREAPPPAPLLVLFHGNGENLETMRQAGVFADFAGLDVAFLAVEYPGYGRSTGPAAEETILAAGEAAHAWAAARRRGRPLVACGWSLGAAVAIQVAARHPDSVDGLIALSPWSSLTELAREYFPAVLVGLLLRERYDSLAAAERVRCPALVVHGRADTIIPCAHGARVAARLGARARHLELPQAGHNDLLAQRETWEELRRFLAGLAPPPL